MRLSLGAWWPGGRNSSAVQQNLELTNFLNFEWNKTIVYVNMAALLHHLCDVLVVQPQDLVIAIVLEAVIQSELDYVTLDKLDLISATLKKTHTYMRSETRVSNIEKNIRKRDAILTPLISPVLISGPLVSRAMATGRYSMLPAPKLSMASRAFLMVSAWYCIKKIIYSQNDCRMF